MVMASLDPDTGARVRTRPDKDPLLTESCDLLFLKIPREA